MDLEQERLEQRKQWFEWYVDQLDSHSVRQPRREANTYRCPCCGCKTLPERGGDDICPVCFWEDDGQDDQDADVVRDGPNRALSLTQARANYRSFGASEERQLPHVRKPLPEEL
jgi:hypothetical protein